MEQSFSWYPNSSSAGQFPDFYGTRWFIAVFTRSHHGALPDPHYVVSTYLPSLPFLENGL